MSVRTVSARLLGVLGAFLFGIATVAAQGFPDRPVQIVVAFPPGGSPDVLARFLAKKLGAMWNKQVLVINRAGAAGNIGAESVAHSAPDGYTLLLAHTGALAVNPSLYRHLPYDPIKDFAPISLVAQVPNVLVANPALPVHSVQQLIAYAKAHPGKVTYGSSGLGGVMFMAMEYFKMLSGTQIKAIQYRGTGQMMSDLVGGRIMVTFNGITGLLPYIKSGQLRALGVGSKQRLALLPDVPTVDESGVKGYEMSTWYGLVAPAGTPKAIIDKINASVREAVKSPEIVKDFSSLGAIPLTDTPAQFSEYIRSETKRWAVVIKKTGAQLD